MLIVQDNNLTDLISIRIQNLLYSFRSKSLSIPLI